MKTTITITTDYPDSVWLLKLKHNCSRASRDWEEHKLFYNLTDAQAYLYREIKRVGNNMLDRLPADYNFHFIADEEGYEASFIITHKNGEQIDRYDGWIYKETIN